MKKIIFLSLLIVAGLFFINNSAYAIDSALSVLPATGNQNINTSFDVSVNINPEGNNVCVVKGTINFDKLSCNSVVVTSGLYSITTPTCENPNFILGIPKCSSVAQNILTISVKGSEIGTGNVFFTNVKVVGAGVFLPAASNSGAYNITSVKALSTEKLEPESLDQASEEPVLENENPVVEENSADATNAAAEEKVSENNNSGNAWTAGFLSVAQKYIWQILIVFLVAIVAYAIYYFITKTKK
jgi:hypothetical protein